MNKMLIIMYRRLKLKFSSESRPKKQRDQPYADSADLRFSYTNYRKLELRVIGF